MRATLMTAWTDAQELGEIPPLMFAATVAVLEETQFYGPDFEGDPMIPTEVSVQINLGDGVVQFYCEFESE